MFKLFRPQNLPVIRTATEASHEAAVGVKC